MRFDRFSGEEPREEGERSEAPEWRSRTEIGLLSSEEESDCGGEKRGVRRWLNLRGVFEFS